MLHGTAAHKHFTSFFLTPASFPRILDTALYSATRTLLQINVNTLFGRGYDLDSAGGLCTLGWLADVSIVQCVILLL